MIDNRICMIERCGQPAVRWHKDGPYQGRGLCASHFKDIGDRVVADVLRDPEIRKLLGLGEILETPGMVTERQP